MSPQYQPYKLKKTSVENGKGKNVSVKEKETFLSICKEVLSDLITPNPCLGCKDKDSACPHPLNVKKLPSVFKNRNEKVNTKRHRFSRPYFTVWLISVDLLIFITAICYYNFAPLGTTWKPKSKQLLRHNLAYETVVVMQQENFWIGPSYTDLIHFGAKYSPCMRKDTGVAALVEMDRKEEDGSGCCVRNDLDVCWQTHNCTSVFSSFYTGKVCGLAREYCPDINLRTNRSLWKGAITTWPNCPLLDRANISKVEKKARPWVGCEVAARPCCFGLQGECIIVSEEECEFRNGYYHENNTLCSQVDCIDNVCGIDVSNMYQFYRIILPTFMHAGVIHLLITFVFLWFIVKPIEQSYGWVRTALIYLGSGVCGTLLSAFFTPYQPEVGPSGSMFGMIGLHIAVNIVEIRYWWNIKHVLETHKGRKTLVFLGICVMLFIPGLLPWIDNWSHLGGFIFGFLIAMAVLSHQVSKTDEEWCHRMILRTSFLVISGLLVILQLYLFYVKQDLFKYMHWPAFFNCIPFTKDFCQDACMDLRPRLRVADQNQSRWACMHWEGE